MIEWKKLLEQTHPDFQSTKENEGTKWISSTRKLKNQIESIPDRLGFKIGEVAGHVGVKQYVLRYWESEFEGFHPKKSKNGQRMYTKKDMETALIIKKLLHEDRFSIEGAKFALKKLRKQIRLSNRTNPSADLSEKFKRLNKPKKVLSPPVSDNFQKSKKPNAHKNTSSNDTDNFQKPNKTIKTFSKKTNDKNPSLESAYALLRYIRQARTSLNL